MVRDPRRVEVDPICHAKGCRSYVVADPKTGETAVIDPLLEHLRETLDAVSGRRQLRWIIETHSHGDHLSGAAALARKTGAEVVTHPASPSDFPDVRAADGHVLPLGAHALRVHHAPGNAADALVVEAPGALFTGDTLLIGTVGLRDAEGSDADAWFATFRRLFDDRDDAVVVHPGHDDMGRTMTTMQAERRGNRWLREDDLEAFRALYRADDRPPAPQTERILQANREGTERVHAAAAATAGFQSPVERGEAERRDRDRPLGRETESTAPAPSRGGTLSLLAGTLCTAGTLAGWWVHPGFHGLSLVAALLLLARGLRLQEARRKRRLAARGTLFYGGAPKSSPT